MTSALTHGFDYSALGDLAIIAQGFAERIHNRISNALSQAVEIGHELREAKAILPHGQFGPWLQAEFEWSHDTAGRYMRLAERFGEIPHGAEIGLKAAYILSSPSVPDEAIAEAVERASDGESITPAVAQEIAIAHSPARDEGSPYRWTNLPNEVQNQVKDGELSVGEANAIYDQKYPQSPAKNVHVSNNSGVSEWYTPPVYVDAARKVLGKIDLDPASCDVAQGWVKAEQYFTAESNGLSQAWSGRVWMNPPYAAGLVDAFIEKFCAHLDGNEIKSGIVLVNNATETRWFQQAASKAAAICFPSGRIRYLDSSGEPANSPLQGQAFLYFGAKPERFIATFSAFGTCAEVSR